MMMRVAVSEGTRKTWATISTCLRRSQDRLQDLSCTFHTLHFLLRSVWMKWINWRSTCSLQIQAWVHAMGCTLKQGSPRSMCSARRTYTHLMSPSLLVKCWGSWAKRALQISVTRALPKRALWETRFDGCSVLMGWSTEDVLCRSLDWLQSKAYTSVLMES